MTTDPYSFPADVGAAGNVGKHAGGVGGGFGRTQRLNFTQRIVPTASAKPSTAELVKRLK
ncbi:hypothetical protein HK102_006923, partial [Quaeritorhiza haematococci]